MFLKRPPDDWRYGDEKKTLPRGLEPSTSLVQGASYIPNDINGTCGPGMDDAYSLTAYVSVRDSSEVAFHEKRRVTSDKMGCCVPLYLVQASGFPRAEKMVRPMGCLDLCHCRFEPIRKLQATTFTTIKNIFTMNLQTLLKVVILLLTPMIVGISPEPCQWLTWRLWWYMLAFISHEITWRRTYVA